MNSKNKIILAVVALLAVVVIAAIISNVSKAGMDSSLKVACNLPASGDIGFYGQYIQSGITMAMSDLKTDMESNGIKIQYDFKDNAGLAKNTVSVFNQQKLQGFDIYMSGVTAQTAAILDLVGETKKPHFIWSFAPFHIEKGQNLYRPWLDMEEEGRCFIRHMEQKKPKKVAFVYQNISSCQEQFNDIILPYAKEAGIEVVYNEAYDVNTNDFKNIVAKVVSLNPDFVIIYGFQNHLAELIKGFNSHNFKKDGNILCSFDFLDVQTILDPKLLDGIIVNIPQYLIDKSDRVSEWKKRFKDIYGRDPLFTDAYAYDLAYTIYYGTLKQKNDKTLSFEDALSSVEFDGMTGHIKYLPNGQLEYNVQPCIYKNGQYVILQNEP